MKIGHAVGTLGGNMRYLPLIAGAAFGITLLILFGVSGAGLCLSIGAGFAAAHGIDGERAWELDDIVIDWFFGEPLWSFPAKLARTLAAITVGSIGGGLAVPVYAQVLVVQAINRGAERIATPDPEEN